MGEVTEVFPSKDNVVRRVCLRTPTGSVVRAIQRLHEILPHVVSSNAGNDSKSGDLDSQRPDLSCRSNPRKSDGDLEPVTIPKSGHVFKPTHKMDL